MSIEVDIIDINAAEEILGPYYEYFYPPNYEIADDCIITSS